MTPVLFDHIAIAAPRMTDAVGMLTGVLGGIRLRAFAAYTTAMVFGPGIEAGCWQTILVAPRPARPAPSRSSGASCRATREHTGVGRRLDPNSRRGCPKQALGRTSSLGRRSQATGRTWLAAIPHPAAGEGGRLRIGSHRPSAPRQWERIALGQHRAGTRATIFSWPPSSIARGQAAPDSRAAMRRYRAFRLASDPMGAA
jgi:hypothetical protein